MEKIESCIFLTETHKITTQDGYILSLTRVLMKPNNYYCLNDETNKSKPVVLLTPGFLCSGDIWCFIEEERGLPYKLIENGFDCWICHFRGSLNSIGHTSLSSDSAEFWDFSLHELATFDIPSIIDYILTTTGTTSLCVAGHSMGASIIFISLASIPELCSKINVFIALAPAVFGNNVKWIIKAPLLAGAFIGNWKYVRNRQVGNLSVYQILKSILPSKRCSESLGAWLIQNFGGLAGACSKNTMSKKNYKRFVTQWPASCSLKVFCHGCQSYCINKARQFDYGRKGNERIYGKRKPPAYNFKDISTPVAMFCSEEDGLAKPQDVYKLEKILTNCVGTYEMKNFKHIDFVVGENVHEIVFPKVINILTKFVINK